MKDEDGGGAGGGYEVTTFSDPQPKYIHAEPTSLPALDPAIGPDPSVHASPEMAALCPYCHPKPAPTPRPAPEAALQQTWRPSVVSMGAMSMTTGRASEARRTGSRGPR